MSKASDITKIYGQFSSAVNKIWLFLGIIGVVLFLIYIVNNNTGSKQTNEAITAEEFGCPLTPFGQELKPNFQPLQTITQISTINYETDVYHTELAKNQIPPILDPKLTDFDTLNSCMSENDEVVVVKIGEDVHIYPKKILVHHLLINDRVNGIPILVTRCNFCNSYAVYRRENRNEELLFGTSGKLYKNNELLFDHKTESLWSQYDGKARVGSLTDSQLPKIQFEVLSFADAHSRYPQADLMSFETGFLRNYNIDPFDEYYTSNELWMRTENFSDQLAIKDQVYGFEINNNYYALTETALEAGSYTTKINGATFTAEQNSIGFKATYGEETIQLTPSFWYVWYDFYPDTKLFR